MTLYQKEVPSEEPLPVHVQPASIEDTVPDAATILVAVKRMLHGKSAGPSGIHVCDILFWEHNCPEIWNEFVLMVQDCSSFVSFPMLNMARCEELFYSKYVTR
jgi:hypothetical protein